jgi:hypothetical protein
MVRFAPLAESGFCSQVNFLIIKGVLKMQKINRNDLAKSAVAGGCCKTANTCKKPVASTPVKVIVKA